jgi:DNA ligase-associated metallophosphoesterase
MSAELAAGGTRFVLLPQRAAWLPEHGTLLVADVHIGKAATFRRLGVPVPQGTTSDAVERLAALVQATGAAQLVVLGDLLHGRLGRVGATLERFARWREAHAALQVTLVRGNHDDRSGDPPPEWRVEVVDGPLRLGGLALVHDPQPVPGAYAVGGHVHPCAWVGRGHDRLRLPCFHFAPEVAVLPAFGDFTGMHALPCGDDDRIYVIAGDAVRAVGRSGARAVRAGR